jgi:hypothetical protein
MHQRCPLSSQHAHVAVDVSVETRTQSGRHPQPPVRVREPFDDSVPWRNDWERSPDLPKSGTRWRHNDPTVGRAANLARYSSTGSGCRQAAVDFEHRARNVGRFRGRNEHDGVREFLRISPSKQRHRRYQRIIAFRGAREAVGHIGVC